MPEKIEASVALGAEPCLDTAPDRLTVRQQILEEILDHIADIHLLADWH
jgi:hypothetical protein